jgi:excisionase family DNA binding protein
VNTEHQTVADSAATSPVDIELRIYTRQEAADILRVCKRTFSRELKRGNITGIRIGDRIVFPHAEIARYIDAKMKMALEARAKATAEETTTA